MNNHHKIITDADESDKVGVGMLNYIQQGIMFDLSLNETAKKPYYNSQIVLTFKTPITKDILIKAWQITLNNNRDLFSLKLSKNHSVTTYPIADSINLPFYYHDISSKTFTEQTCYLNDLIKKEIDIPFDLQIAPLIRITFVHIENSLNKLIWTKHHLLMDGEGSFILLRDVFKIYYQILHGKYKSQNSMNANYTYLLPTKIRGEVAYWKKALSIHEKSSYLFSPETFAQKIKHYQIKEAKFVIGAKNLQMMDKYIKTHVLTLSCLLQGALAITLSIYSNSNDVVYGMVRRFPNRETYGIGLFTNTVPVALNINYNQCLYDYLKSILENNKNVRKFCKTPLKKIKKLGNIPADKPLFQILFDYKPKSLDTMLNQLYPDINCQSEFHLKIPYPFTFEIVNKGKELAITLSYDSNLFDREYVDRIFATYSRVLNEIVSGKINKISDIETLNKNEFKKIVVDWNKTTEKQVKKKTLHEHIEYHAKNNGDKQAIIYGKKSLTYRSLNKLANQFARYLQSRGVGHETRVALILPPSFFQYIGLLATLKCGATIVPIDIKYPSVRIMSMLSLSNAEYIITTSELSNQFVQIGVLEKSIRIIEIDSDESIWKKYSDCNLKYNVSMESEAYIVFTSGSTGIPKGVIVEHKQWISILYSTIWRLNVKNNDKILQLSSFSFDVFQCEWGMALLSGCSLCIFDNIHYSSKKIIEVLREYAISLIICSSSILTGLPHASLPSLKKIAIGGESCDKKTLDYWSKNTKIYHVYGVTEATICSTIGRYYPNQEKLLMGKPLVFVKIYIFNSRMDLCPINVPGEIYIGGEGVAKGYLDSQETDKKFINHSINGREERLYKTGDLARWLSSGEIEFVGRVDSLIKIRGHRVELSEVENSIINIRGVSKACAAVISRGNKKYLVACVLANNKYLSAEGIKYLLSENLPSYMIPHHIAIVDEIPLTVNGKIDKEKTCDKALISLEEFGKTKPLLENSANKEIITSIKNIAEDLLSIKNISINKNFFDLGFDSITLSLFHVSIEKLLSFELNLIDLLTHSTIELLAEFISVKRRGV